MADEFWFVYCFIGVAFITLQRTHIWNLVLDLRRGIVLYWAFNSSHSSLLMKISVHLEAFHFYTFLWSLIDGDWQIACKKWEKSWQKEMIRTECVSFWKNKLPFYSWFPQPFVICSHAQFRINRKENMSTSWVGFVTIWRDNKHHADF